LDSIPFFYFIASNSHGRYIANDFTSDFFFGCYNNWLLNISAEKAYFRVSQKFFSAYEQYLQAAFLINI